MIVEAFRAGVSEDILRQLPSSSRVVPHFNGGKYIADLVYRLRLFDKNSSFWVEVHTGSEGYDEKIFLRRLVTMSHFLADRMNDFFVVIVPFQRDVTTGLAAEVRKGNRITSVISLEKIKLLSYNQIAAFKESFGFYQHSTR
jgi:hypothetical protein